MGVFAGVDASGGVNVAAIARAMRPTVALWFTGRFQILRPQAPSRYRFDPVADTYTDTQGGPVGAVETVFDSGENGALFQPIRSAAPITVATQGTNIQSVRIQTHRPEGDIEIQSGLLVRILDGGEDSSLERFVYSLKGQPGTSLAWGSILECTVVTSSKWA